MTIDRIPPARQPVSAASGVARRVAAFERDVAKARPTGADAASAAPGGRADRGSGSPPGRARRSAASSGPKPASSGAGRTGDQAHTRSQDAGGSTASLARPARTPWSNYCSGAAASSWSTTAADGA
ncbi:hypothetical protein AB0N77_21960 [Streptomyces misionensis]|uniref:hypothetical protein n=1 Tax=Streptomyces misionensis TaxID=67331 RepID=UPI00342A4376